MSRRAARMAELAAYFEANAPALRRFAFYLCADWSVADDLVQEAFLRVWRAGGRADRDGILTYCRRSIATIHRSHFRRLLLERRALRRNAPDDRVEAVDVSERDRLRGALMKLSPQQRACVALRYYEDLTEREIGDLLGITEGSVRRHVARAMTTLRTRLEGE